jgi:hypothetical protein
MVAATRLRTSPRPATTQWAFFMELPRGVPVLSRATAPHVAAHPKKRKARIATSLVVSR